jgi:hypothetical protein
VRSDNYRGDTTFTVRLPGAQSRVRDPRLA